MPLDLKKAAAAIAASKRENKTERFTMLLKPSNLEKLKNAAKHYNCSVNALMDELIGQIEIPEETNNQSTDK